MNENRMSLTPSDVIMDYRMAYRSRQVSLIGRREVLNGRAKFGIFGAGKEIPQLAMAHVFEQGDFRSGYYRDQTLMLALGEISVASFFAQLYAHTDVSAEPASAGRMMNAHFATRSLNPDGSWRDLTQQYNSAADVSPTASQMPRLVGLAYASRLYRELESLAHLTNFSHKGNEVAFGIIGNGSCAEGIFWEAVNAIGLLAVPAVISIWDDGYGISVPNKYQILKQDLSALLAGFKRQEGGEGFELYTVKGWDYPALIDTYQKAATIARQEHVPVIIHVTDLTQSQGHSTSGSHERYKSPERLQWEKDVDGLKRMREWMISSGIATDEALSEYERLERSSVRAEGEAAWNAFVASLEGDREEVRGLIDTVASHSAHANQLVEVRQKMYQLNYPRRRDMMRAIFETLKVTRQEQIAAKEALMAWRDEHQMSFQALYSSHLTSQTVESPLNVLAVPPIYRHNAPQVNGFALLNRFFDSVLAGDPRIIIFGEDVGHLGGVNQALAGLQAKYGELRVSDTGIRESTIMGQAIGMAMRGLRPIAEIQYLDYLLYALQIMSDDLATLHWRTKGGQKAPVIIRTRGYRLEGVWHSGSPMGSLLNLVRGIHVLVPRDMTRAAGFYNTLLNGDDPGIIVEVLNAYRKKEALPDNLKNITIPLGVPEILRQGSDVTLITYGALCPIALQAATSLSAVGIEVEVIDVQSLLPFDIKHQIVESLKKTNRLICVDEDVPGGASAFMLQQVLEKQGGFRWLDSQPRTLTAQAHRPAYGSDGDYFSKPNKEQIFEMIYDLMHEANPANYPLFYQQGDSSHLVSAVGDKTPQASPIKRHSNGSNGHQASNRSNGSTSSKPISWDIVQLEALKNDYQW